MIQRLTSFSTLPVRPEYIRRVRLALQGRAERPLVWIIQETRLTRNQVLCALDALTRDGAVTKKGKNIFSLVE